MFIKNSLLLALCITKCHEISRVILRTTTWGTIEKGRSFKKHDNWADNTSFLHASAPYVQLLDNGFAIQSFYTIGKSFFLWGDPKSPVAQSGIRKILKQSHLTNKVKYFMLG